MFVLDSVACADAFPADGARGGAQIVAQNGSTGGYATVTDADVYVQLAYQAAAGSSLEWTPAVHVAPGNLILAAGTRGIRFRNYVAGQVATVSAGLSEPLEPPLQLTSAGVSGSVSGNLTGITGHVSAAGAILAGSGYTIAKGAAGLYTVNFTTPFAAPPVVVGDVIIGAGGNLQFTPNTILAGSFGVITGNSAGAGVDLEFNFLAIAVI